MAAPQMTVGTQYGALASQALAAGASVSFAVDFSAVYEGQLQIFSSPGATVAATNGLQISIFPRVGNPVANDTVAAVGPFTIPSVASTPAYQTIKLSTGRYSITLKNLDATNGLTAVGATADTISSIQ